MTVQTVVTETSTYLLDLDAMTATRLPGQGGGQVDGLPPAEIADLRRDTAPIPLLAVPTPRVGEPMTLLLAIRDDGVTTVRQTTIVREIR